jgi:hypothetical protein
MLRWQLMTSGIALRVAQPGDVGALHGDCALVSTPDDIAALPLR